MAIRQTLHNEVTLPRRRKPDTLRDFEAICLKCLEKNSAKRYASMEALADDLQRFAEHRPVSARRIGLAQRTYHWVKRRPQVALLMLVGLLFLTAQPLIKIVRDRRQQASLRAEAIQLASAAREILERNASAGSIES